MAAIDLYPLLRNDDIWGQTVGTNWNMMACKRHDCIFLSSSLLGMSAVFHCLSLSKLEGKSSHLIIMMVMINIVYQSSLLQAGLP